MKPFNIGMAVVAAVTAMTMVGPENATVETSGTRGSGS
jgi:hypothetical protein